MSDPTEINRPSVLCTVYGAREILRLCGASTQLEHHVEELERSVEENTGLAFDAAKALLETVCKTILIDRAVPVQGGWDLQELFRNTLKVLHLIPEDRTDAKNTHEGLRKTMNGLQTAIHGLSELRNREGSISHGKDAYALMMEHVQARFAVQAADALAYFIYGAHQAYPTVPTPPLKYEDNKKFNDFIDSTYDEVQIGDGIYQASEVLYYTDRSAYKEQLDLFLNENVANDES